MVSDNPDQGLRDMEFFIRQHSLIGDIFPELKEFVFVKNLVLEHIITNSQRDVT